MDGVPIVFDEIPRTHHGMAVASKSAEYVEHVLRAHRLVQGHAQQLVDQGGLLGVAWLTQTEISRVSVLVYLVYKTRYREDFWE